MIKLVTRKKLVIGTLTCAAILIAFAAYKVIKKDTSVVAEEPQSVMASKASFGPVEKYINTVGTLIPNDSVELKSEVSAKIDKILFKEGALVEKGDLLIQFDESLVKAEVLDAEARYKKAKTEYEALSKLADRGAASKINKTKALSEMEICAASVNSAKAKLAKHKIFAPFGGRIGVRDVSEGQFIQMGEHLVRLVDYHPMKIDFNIAEVDIDKVYVSQEISVFVGGDERQEYKAKVFAIEPESDRINHSFRVRAILDVPEDIALDSEVLKPGRFAKVRVTIDDGALGILVPESAIEKSGTEDTLFIVSGGLAMRRIVTIGMKKGGYAEIITGVNEGDMVIVKGSQGVSDGLPVTIRDSISMSELTNAFKQYYKTHPDQKKLKK
ncbi:MAG: efflux RND transporter periplasmic adaptor subunit [Alphaproteobacteria bacterium]|nr:efflux RND transporter periplasmic adaptor subunit [Alphaproteobacteria bacterium]